MRSDHGDVAHWAWPLSRLGEMLLLVVRRSGLAVKAAPPLSAPTYPEQVGAWLESAGSMLGVEVTSTRARYADLRNTLSIAVPIVAMLADGEPRFLAVLRCTRRRCVLLAPDLRRINVPLDAVVKVIVADLEADALPAIQETAASVGGTAAQVSALERVLLEQELAGATVNGLFQLQLGPQASFASALRRAGVPGAFARFVGTYAVQYGLWLISWWIAAQWALRGLVEWGWVAAWVLLLATVIPLQLYTRWLEGAMSITIGALLKQRLLTAGMRFDIDELRKLGPSSLLARTLEAQVVEQATINGVLLAILGTIELAYGAAVLSAGLAGPWHAAVLVAWCALFIYAWWRYFRWREAWTNERLSMTHDLVERMLGYRTRLAQQQPSHWHDGEDEALSGYLVQSRRMDDLGVLMTPMPWHGWLAVAVAALVIASVATPRVETVKLAISLGGCLLSARALQKWVLAFGFATDAAIAWAQVRSFFGVRSDGDHPGLPDIGASTCAATAAFNLDAKGLVFTYGASSRTVIDGWSVKIRAGDRILLTGPSGGGKSTLASLLAGARQPNGGALLLGGLDQFTIGTAIWRKRVAAAPQFHENHIVAGTFIFNLLMGRQWPPTGSDVREALDVCRDLGLDELLKKMPGGLLQFVGETGWQLSHGEKSRIYIARALLQRPGLVILDESFGALDPETFERTLRCVLTRAPALLMIAHP